MHWESTFSSWLMASESTLFVCSGEKYSTKSKEEDANASRPREDDESSNWREDEPAQVCSKKDETVAVPREVNLTGKPRVS